MAEMQGFARLPRRSSLTCLIGILAVAIVGGQPLAARAQPQSPAAEVRDGEAFQISMPSPQVPVCFLWPPERRHAEACQGLAPAQLETALSGGQSLPGSATLLAQALLRFPDWVATVRITRGPERPEVAPGREQEVAATSLAGAEFVREHGSVGANLDRQSSSPVQLKRVGGVQLARQTIAPVPADAAGNRQVVLTNLLFAEGGVYGVSLRLPAEQAATGMALADGILATVKARPTKLKPAKGDSAQWGFLAGLLLTLVAAQYFFRLSKAPPESPPRQRRPTAPPPAPGADGA